jgi:hypothetical protein
MSELKVNKVTPRSGTTVTLGDSGDTITIPSGATITNSGTATGFGKVLQVVSTSKTDTFSLSTGSTYTDITGLSVSITPSSASNKILIMYNVSVGSNGTSGFAYTKLLRGSTSIFVGDTAGSRISASNGGTSISSNVISKHCIQFLDSPATTSSTTYKIQAYAQVGTAQIYVNRTYTDTDNSGFTRDASSITVMEIAG